MRVLISGITGRVGSAFAEAVLGGPDQMTAMLRPLVSRTASDRWNRLGVAGNALDGDLCLPMWGIDPADAGDVEVVVNLAANTRWGAAPADHYRANVLGALNGLELASAIGTASGHDVLYCHISSAFVSGSSTGFIPECWHGPDSGRTSYERSKWLAETRLRQRARELPNVRLRVVRLGGIIGGNPDNPYGLSTLELLALRDRLPAGRFPVIAGGRVDVLDRDVAARVLLQTIRFLYDATESPEVFHLCAGTSAPSLEAVVAAAKYASPGFAGGGRTVALPKSTAKWLRSPMLRSFSFSSTTTALLDGLKYVSEDRVYERHNLAVAIDELPEAPSCEQISEQVFGASTAPEAIAPEPLGSGLFVA